MKQIAFKITLHTTPHYLMLFITALLIAFLHGDNLELYSIKHIQESVANEIIQSNLITKISVIAIWYLLYTLSLIKIYNLLFL